MSHFATRKLPPALYSIHDDQDRWVIMLSDRQSSSVSITKSAENDLGNRYAYPAGNLQFSNPPEGFTDSPVPFGHWNLSKREVLGKKTKIKGWILVIGVEHPRTHIWQNIDFGFQSRKNGPRVRRWVTSINRDLAPLRKRMPPPSPR